MITCSCRCTLFIQSKQPNVNPEFTYESFAFVEVATKGGKFNRFHVIWMLPYNTEYRDDQESVTQQWVPQKRLRT